MHQAYAVYEGDTAIHEIEVETPEATGRSVLLKVLRSGVCHTDTHLREGGYDLGSRGTMSLTDRGVPYPLVMGHEVVGEVTAVGDEVQDVRVGQRMLVYPWIGCGECRMCREGRDNACAAGKNLGVARHGGYAETLWVPDAKYLVDIGDLDPSWTATLACSGITAYSAVDQVLPLDEEESVVVIGAGGLGLTAIALLSARGHRTVVAVDRSEKNLELARQMGASATVVSDDDVAAALKEALGGGAAAVIDFVNNGATATLGFDSLAKAGQMVQVGLFGGEVTLPNALLSLKMIRISGSFVGTLQQMKDLVQIARTTDLPKIPIIERQLSAEQVAASLDDLTAGTVSGRVVLTA
ncbi:zinc-binding dehydrogenase [Micrococcus luteus]|nr:zinc-binding dehydrogenase [Micrococcus luteus]